MNVATILSQLNSVFIFTIIEVSVCDYKIVNQFRAHSFNNDSSSSFISKLLEQIAMYIYA